MIGIGPKAWCTMKDSRQSPPQWYRLLRQHLALAEWTQACQVVMKLRETHELPGGSGLIGQLKRILGRDDFIRLIEAFARNACPFCKMGLHVCAACKGKAAAVRGSPCPACACTGSQPCEFCTGSGLAAYSFGPEEFRPLVLQARIAMVARQLSKLSAKYESSRHLAEAHINYLLNLNKLLGVLENAAIETNFQRDRHLIDRVVYSKHKKRIWNLARTVYTELSAGLGALAGDASTDDQKSSFYRDAAQPNGLVDTPFEHPTLRRLLELQSGKPGK